MLAGPKCPLVRIFRIIPCDVFFNGGEGTLVNRFLDKEFTTNFRPFMHSLNHLIPSFRVVDFMHPGPHNVYSAKNNFAFLFTFFKTWESRHDTSSFYTTLV